MDELAYGLSQGGGMTLVLFSLGGVYLFGPFILYFGLKFFVRKFSGVPTEWRGWRKLLAVFSCAIAPHFILWGDYYYGELVYFKPVCDSLNSFQSNEKVKFNGIRARVLSNLNDDSSLESMADYLFDETGLDYVEIEVGKGGVKYYDSNNDFKWHSGVQRKITSGGWELLPGYYRASLSCDLSEVYSFRDRLKRHCFKVVYLGASAGEMDLNINQYDYKLLDGRFIIQKGTVEIKNTVSGKVVFHAEDASYYGGWLDKWLTLNSPKVYYSGLLSRDLSRCGQIPSVRNFFDKIKDKD